MPITQAEWKSKSRKQKYEYFRSLGYSRNEAYKARDWGFKKASQYRKFVGPSKPPVKKVKKSKNYTHEVWREFSSYWQKSKSEKREMSKDWPAWKKRAANKWEKEAIETNRKIWFNIPAAERNNIRTRQITNGDPLWHEFHHAGFKATYDRYINGMNWEQAIRGVRIDLDSEMPEQY